MAAMPAGPLEGFSSTAWTDRSVPQVAGRPAVCLPLDTCCMLAHLHEVSLCNFPEREGEVGTRGIRPRTATMRIVTEGTTMTATVSLPSTTSMVMHHRREVKSTTTTAIAGTVSSMTTA